MSEIKQNPLQDKVAFITGGARGIGRAIAIKLAKNGVNVAINYYNSVDEAETLCEELRSFGVKAISLHGSVAEPSSIKEMIAEFEKHFDSLDFLINNAASGVLKPMMEMGPKHWRWCMETNALALPMLIKTAKHLLKPGSKVIAMTSQGSQKYIPDYGFIGASKAALESLVRSLSVELAPDGISLNTLCAGAVDTDALKYFPSHKELLEKSQARSLTGRNVTPSDVADVAYLLCLPESNMIKGQTIVVDAGYSLTG